MEPNNERNVVLQAVGTELKPFCTLDQLRAWFEGSPLAHKFLIVHMTNDLEQVSSSLQFDSTLNSTRN